MFLWEAAHRRTMCNSERKKRHFIQNDLCMVYGRASEDVFRVLRDCSHAKELWNLLGAQQIFSDFFRISSVDDLIFHNLRLAARQIGGVGWDIIFAFATWFIWKNRNAIVFRSLVSTSEGLKTAVISQAGHSRKNLGKSTSSWGMTCT